MQLYFSSKASVIASSEPSSLRSVRCVSTFNVSFSPLVEFGLSVDEAPDVLPDSSDVVLVVSLQADIEIVVAATSTPANTFLKFIVFLLFVSLNYLL